MIDNIPCNKINRINNILLLILSIIDNNVCLASTTSSNIYNLLLDDRVFNHLFGVSISSPPIKVCIFSDNSYATLISE